MLLRSAIVAVGVLGFAGVAQARSVPLDRARDANVSVDLVSPGGYHEVTVTLRNRGEDPVTITGLPGMVLENRNQSEQDLTFSGPLNLAVGPGQSVTNTVGVYCIRPDRSSPSAGARFDVGQFDSGLADMMRGRSSARADGSTQSAVWDFMRNRNVVQPRPAQLQCVGPDGGLRICVNPNATPVQNAPNVAPMPPTPTQIPIIQLPEPVPTPPPAAPIVRRQRPRHHPQRPQAPIGQPDPRTPQGLVIEDD
ncbi:MAG: hypothetical protein HYY06_29640 [Deltaproteobacteria bacterium]|nr:hypothetical protein [Deltaproteobacteria bacterium]